MLWDLVVHDEAQIFWGVHREELKRSAIKQFQALAGYPPVVWDSNNKPEEWGAVNVVMIPSSRKIPGKNTRGKYKMRVLAIDEAHHDEAPTWKKFRAAINADWELMITATPGEVQLDRVGKNSPKIIVPFKTLVDEGYLAKPVYEKVRTHIAANMALRGGDYTAQSLKRLNCPKRQQVVFDHWVANKAKYGKTLIFAPSVEECETLYRHWTKHGEKAFMVLGSTPKIRRETDIAAFSEDTEPSVMITRDVFIEGVDIPEVRTIFMCRPTLSARVYTQMIGRGSRIAGGPIFYVVDFVDNIKRYETRSAAMLVDALGRDYVPQEILEIADRPGKLQYLAAQGVLVQHIKAVDIDAVVGCVQWSNRYCDNKVQPLLEDDVEALWATFNLIRQVYRDKGDLKSCINTTYGEVGVLTSLSFPQWKNACWGMIAGFKRGGVDSPVGMNFRMSFLSPDLKPDATRLRDYNEYALAQQEALSDINAEWLGEERSLWSSILEDVELTKSNKYMVPALRSNFAPTEYQNRMLVLRAHPRTRVKDDNAQWDEPCVKNLGIWKRVLLKSLRNVVNDECAEVVITYPAPSPTTEGK